MKTKNKILALALALIICAAPLLSCSTQAKYQTKYIFAMDTDINIYIDASRDATELLALCEQAIYNFENIVSKTRTGSDVYKLNAGEHVVCDDVTLYLISAAGMVNELSGGLFDPTVAGLVSMWDECEKENTLPSAERLEAELALVGFDGVNVGELGEVWLDEGVTLDLGGIAKGYVEEAVSELIKENAQAYGVRGYMLDFGGMIGAFGEKPSGENYRIGIKNPDGSGANKGLVELSSGFVSVSGDYERFYTVGGEKYHHIIDPKTGYPAETGLSAVAVISDDGTLADALSTALFLMGYERSVELYESGIFEFEAVFFMSGGDVRTTPNANYFE